jgi:phage recombination protein Bet
MKKGRTLICDHMAYKEPLLTEHKTYFLTINKSEMKNEIVKVDAIEKVSDEILLSHLENLGLLKDLTKGEKDTYMQICKAYNLNPFKREIHVSKYNGQMSIITGYETYIKRAERSGALDGWDVKVEGEIKPILAESTMKAIITIYRKDRTRPFVWEAKFTEYMQLKDGKLNKFWQKSETMIKKVAMAQGFRLCFNDELGGMPYTGDEVGAVEDITHEVVEPVVVVPKVDPEEIASWISKLPACNNAKDLKELKALVPAYIVSDASFITAAKERYSVVMAEAAKV